MTYQLLGVTGRTNVIHHNGVVLASQERHFVVRSRAKSVANHALLFDRHSMHYGLSSGTMLPGVKAISNDFHRRSATPGLWFASHLNAPLLVFESRAKAAV